MLENIILLISSAEEIVGQNWDISDLFDFGSGIFAAFLLILSLMAYRIVKTKRLLFVSAAFGLFALRTIIDNLDIFFPDIESLPIDIATAVTGFAILALFFFAIAKKGVQKKEPEG